MEFIIYKLVCKDLSIKECYVGSTKNFRRRKCNHKKSATCNTDKCYNQKKYSFIRENGGWDNWDMIEIEKYPCNDHNEARARERYYTEKLHSELNDRVPFRDEESKKLYKKEHYKSKEEHYKQKRKERGVTEDQRVKAILRANQYRLDNPDKVKEARRKREQIKTVCGCGSTYASCIKSKHIKTKRHLKYLEDIKDGNEEIQYH